MSDTDFLDAGQASPTYRPTEFRELKQDTTKRGVAARHVTPERTVYYVSDRPKPKPTYEQAIREWEERTFKTRAAPLPPPPPKPVFPEIEPPKRTVVRATQSSGLTHHVREVLRGARRSLTTREILAVLIETDPEQFGSCDVPGISAVLNNERKANRVRKEQVRNKAAWCLTEKGLAVFQEEGAA